MKYIFLVSLIIAVSASAQNNKASFSHFQYKGKDMCFEQIIDPITQYRNPVLPGMYPDPSICRRGNDYFLINSSFCYFPGIPIFHSTDLVHWKQIGHVLDHSSQLELDGIGLSSGVYAPAIEYNEKNQTFYVICTVVKGIGNFIVKSKNPFKGWSDPIQLPEVIGIDPSLFFDDDGKSYIVSSNTSQNPKWIGHTQIWMQEFDVEKDKAAVERHLLVDGGQDTIKQPRWIEGPHVYKENGMYYLMTAEGGTLSGHKELIFKSDKIEGPFIAGKNNPILTQLGVSTDKKNKVSHVGHADMIKTANGDWYAVFLGCRIYDYEQFNTGRETFMLPVKWTDGFPVILENGKEVPPIVTKKDMNKKGKTLSGNFTWRDDFNSSTLDMKWNMIRTPREQWWKISKGNIYIEVLPRSLKQLVNPAFIGRRQQHLRFEVSTALNFIPKTDAELAGLAYFQNEKNYFVIGKILKDDKQVVVLTSVVAGVAKAIANAELPFVSANKEMIIGIIVNEGIGTFYYSEKKGKRVILAENVDITNLSTKKAKGFIGSYIGMYATGLGY